MSISAAASLRRRMAILRDAEPLRCPDGHPIPRDAWVPGAAAVRCKHRAAHQPNNQCGVVVLVLALIEGVRAVVEITPQEAQVIEAKRMKPAEIQEFLALGWMTAERRHG